MVRFAEHVKLTVLQPARITVCSARGDWWIENAAGWTLGVDKAGTRIIKTFSTFLVRIFSKMVQRPQG
jgi:hypothetical protein